MATTAQALLTIEEFRNLPDTEMEQELSEGELIEMPPAAHKHSRVCRTILRSLIRWIDESDIGFEEYIETAFALSDDPPTVRVPDVALVRSDRVQQELEGYIPGPPDLAIEVVSPSNSAADLNQKVEQYLRYGSAAVLVIYPLTKEIYRYSADDPPTLFREGDIVTAPEVAPGWSIKVSELF